MIPLKIKTIKINFHSFLCKLAIDLSQDDKLVDNIDRVFALKLSFKIRFTMSKLKFVKFTSGFLKIFLAVSDLLSMQCVIILSSVSYPYDKLEPPALFKEVYGIYYMAFRIVSLFLLVCSEIC